MATFQLFFHSGRAKDLSAPMYVCVCVCACDLCFTVRHEHSLGIFQVPSVIFPETEKEAEEG